MIVTNVLGCGGRGGDRPSDEAAQLTPVLSEVARVRSVYAHAVNASLPTDRFAAAH